MYIYRIGGSFQLLILWIWMLSVKITTLNVLFAHVIVLYAFSSPNLFSRNITALKKTHLHVHCTVHVLYCRCTLYTILLLIFTIMSMHAPHPSIIYHNLS